MGPGLGRATVHRHGSCGTPLLLQPHAPSWARCTPGPACFCAAGVKPGHSMGLSSCDSCERVLAGRQLRGRLSMPMTRQEMLG